MATLPSWAEPQLATLTRERFSDPGWIFERKQHLPGNRPGPLLGYYDRDGELVYAGKVGTGFDRKTLLSLHDRLAGLERADPAFRHGRLPSPRGVHWVEPRLVGEVGFSEWTDDGQLRHPRFQGLRDDKKPAAVVREIPS
jgi:ATP-dependent DNA ligase